MFTTLRITAVPDHLRGYLSRFLVEYGTGLYVGNVSKRVAESLWTKAVDAAAEGEIIMVTSSPRSEQGFNVQLHNARGKDVIDLDGVTLVKSIPTIAYGEKDSVS